MGTEGVTALSLRDRATKFIAGHVVDAKGAGPQHAVSQVLRDLRRMGHHAKVVIKTDQENAISYLF